MKSTDVKEVYHADYFLKAVDGYKEFHDFDGKFESLFNRYQRNISLLGLRPSHVLLEFGCGRGEICIFHAMSGGRVTGIDFSSDAIQLAKEKAEELSVSVQFIEGSFDQIDLKKGFYDRILASEFIEHISIEEGKEFFKRAFQLLKPGGKILVFTHPNTLQRRFGYPILRIVSALRGIVLPRIQQDTLDEHYTKYHLNEQNYFTLKSSAQHAGFKNIKIGYDAYFSSSKPVIRFLGAIVMHTFLRHLFLTNLYLLAEK